MASLDMLVVGQLSWSDGASFNPGVATNRAVHVDVTGASVVRGRALVAGVTLACAQQKPHPTNFQ
jgi:hypothetical protein